MIVGSRDIGEHACHSSFPSEFVVSFFRIVSPTLQMSRAPQRQDRTDHRGASAPFACWTAVRLSLSQFSPPRVHQQPIHPPSGALPARPATLETMTSPSSVDSSPVNRNTEAGRPPAGRGVENRQTQRFGDDDPIGTPHTAPPPESATTHALDTDLLQMTRMAVVALIRSFVRCRFSFIRPSNVRLEPRATVT